jgi:hypothetical protein
MATNNMGKYLSKYIEQFHQDILTINNSLDDAIKEALGALSSYEKRQLKTELDEIFSDPSIRFDAIWNSSVSPFRLRNEASAREVLGKILALL